jgi:hypothetical protein
MKRLQKPVMLTITKVPATVLLAAAEKGCVVNVLNTTGAGESCRGATFPKRKSGAGIVPSTALST